VQLTIQEEDMRGTFGLLAMVIAMAIGVFIYSRQAQSVSGLAPNANPQATVNVIGVKNDLIAIANAERAFNAEQGRYASLDELTSGKYMSIRGGGRDPYTYGVDITGGSFRVTADTSAPGAPPHLWVDDSMVVQSSN
jgi:hypothetical protein